MARQTLISAEEIQRAMQLRDQATSVAEYIIALSVILRDAVGLDADQTAEVLGTSRITVFRNRKHICNQDSAVKRLWGGLLSLLFCNFIAKKKGLYLLI